MSVAVGFEGPGAEIGIDTGAGRLSGQSQPQGSAAANMRGEAGPRAAGVSSSQSSAAGQVSFRSQWQSFFEASAAGGSEKEGTNGSPMQGLAGPWTKQTGQSPENSFSAVETGSQQRSELQAISAPSIASNLRAAAAQADAGAFRQADGSETSSASIQSESNDSPGAGSAASGKKAEHKAGEQVPQQISAQGPATAAIAVLPIPVVTPAAALPQSANSLSPSGSAAAESFLTHAAFDAERTGTGVTSTGQSKAANHVSAPAAPAAPAVRTGLTHPVQANAQAGDSTGTDDSVTDRLSIANDGEARAAGVQSSSSNHFAAQGNEPPRSSADREAPIAGDPSNLATSAAGTAVSGPNLGQGAEPADMASIASSEQAARAAGVDPAGARAAAGQVAGRTARGSGATDAAQPGNHIQAQAAGMAGDASALGRDLNGAHSAAGALREGAGPSTEAVAMGPRETFAALDGGTGLGTPSWLHAGAQRAEAGFQDPTLGWVGVRADLSAGSVHAAVVPGSAEAAQALGGHMAGLSAYLADHHAGVETVTMASPEGGAANGSGASGEGMGGNAGQDGSSRPQSGVEGDRVAAQPLPMAVEAGSAGTSAPPMRPGGRISVMA